MPARWLQAAGMSIAAPYRPAGRWFVLVMLVLVRVAMGFQFQAAAGTGPDLIRVFGVDYATIGSLIGFYVLPGLIVALPGGFLASRVGEKNILMVGLGLMTAGAVISGLGDTYTMVAAGRLACGFGVVMLFVVMTKAVGDWFQGGDRFLAMGLFLNGWPLGMAIGLIVDPFIVAWLSWRWIFHISAIGTALALLTMYATFRHPPLAPGHVHEAGGRGLSLRAIVLVSLAGATWSIINGGHISVISFVPDYLVSRGVGRAEAGSLSSINLWATMLGVPIGGWLAARTGRPAAMTSVTVLIGAACAALATVTDSYSVWVILFALGGTFIFMGGGVMAALPMEALSLANRAFGLGLFYTWWYAGFALLPAAAGWTRDVSGNPAAPLWFGAALILLTPPMLFVFRLLQRRWRA